MAAIEKSFGQPPSIIWNLLNDIVEMRKGKITNYDEGSMSIDTMMYGIKTSYVFRVARSQEGATVTVETKGDSEDDERRVLLMFATLENMLAPFMEPGNL